MRIYLVTVICKLTHDVQIWSTSAESLDEAKKIVLKASNTGNQRGMWDIGVDEYGKEEIVEVTDDTMMLAAYDY